MEENLADAVTSTATGHNPLVDRLLKKKPRRKTVSVTLEDDGGEEEKVELVFQAIGAEEYDRLVASCPPTKQDKADGLSYDLDKFGPRLLSAVSYDPLLTVEEAQAIWNSEMWNRGERMALFSAAIEVCTKGLEIPFTSNG